jgi:hypothetical protein
MQEPIGVDNKNGWKRLDLQLLAHLAWAQLAGLHGLGLEDARECVFNGVDRIGLCEVSHISE